MQSCKPGILLIAGKAKWSGMRIREQWIPWDRAKCIIEHIQDNWGCLQTGAPIAQILAESSGTSKHGRHVGTGTDIWSVRRNR